MYVVVSMAMQSFDRHVTTIVNAIFFVFLYLYILLPPKDIIKCIGMVEIPWGKTASSY